MTLTPRLYGIWPSPLTSRGLGAAARLLDARWDAATDTLVWLEQRNGISTLYAQQVTPGLPANAPRALTDPDQTPRARMGYGGGDFTVGGGQVCFAGNGGQLYIQSLTGDRPRPITPAFGQAAAPSFSPDGTWLIALHEYERAECIIATRTDGTTFPTRLVWGDDFYTQPAWHPNGTHIAYVTWTHPRMPWDGSQVRLATLETTRAGLAVTETRTVAGGDDISIYQPEFSPDGRYLAYVSDEAGWWQLYLHDLHTDERIRLTFDEAEYGQPNWVYGLRMYGWTDDGRGIIALRNDRAQVSAHYIDIATRTGRMIPTRPYTLLSQISVHPRRRSFVALAAAPDTPDRVVLFDTAPSLPITISAISAGTTPGIMVQTEDGPRQRIVQRAASESIPADRLSASHVIQWRDPDDATSLVHGIYYPPASDRHTGIGLPPLLVHIHGGPTSQVMHGYSPEMQFFATRGFAVLQVNHRGGTGYGKAYKDQGRGAWGVYEVADAVSGMRHLAAEGLIDPQKAIIMGSSSGGFAVLHALVTRPGVFRAGVCRAGIADQFSLLKEGLDRFEERYSETILGVLPEALPVYKARSPLLHAHTITDPLILFHGADDTNVPVENSQQIAAALNRRGIPCELHLYPGEGHSFRKPDTLEDYYTKIIAFLHRHVVYG